MSQPGYPSQVHTLHRGRRFALNDIATTNAAAIVQAYATQVGLNQGGFLSNQTLQSLIGLVNGLMIDGLWSKVLILNPYVPDSLVASWTPILQGLGQAGFVLWQAFGAWVAGDLTVNGLAGNGSSKYLVTNFSPSNFAAGSMAVVHYNSTVTATGFTSGGYSSGSNGILCAAKYTDNDYYSTMGDTVNNNFNAASPGAGYYCHSRVSTSDHRLYYASSGSAHAQLGSTDATLFSGPYVNQSMYVHALHNNIAGPQLYTADRISFWAALTGLTSGDSLNLFNRIQAYRTSIGGGFV